MSKMKKCKVCSKEIAYNAKTCPECGAKNKKAIYKRPWFIVLAIFIILASVGGANDKDSTVASNENINEVAQNQYKEISNNQGEEKDVLAKQNEENLEEKEEKIENKVTKEYKSALRKAKVYSDTMGMSKAGLYDQLTSEYGEKFSAEAAQYAVDNLDANWKENALKKAKVYQETMAMSSSAIYDQLVSEYGEKFTEEEAQYAVDNLE